MKYDHKAIEPKWQEKWEEAGVPSGRPAVEMKKSIYIEKPCGFMAFIIQENCDISMLRR